METYHAAQRLYDDAINGRLSTELAVERAQHLERVSPDAAAMLWQKLQDWRSRRGLSAEEVPLTEDEFEDRPRHRFPTRLSAADRTLLGTSSTRPARVAG